MSIREEIERLRQIAECLGISLYYHGFKLATNLIDRREGVIAHRVSQLLARHLLQHLGMRVHRSGLGRVEGMTRYCVIANHVSYLDWAVLLGYFPSPLRFIAKRELLSIPVIGSYLGERAVLIDRTRGRDALGAIRAATQDGQPWPILLFPEGTRSWTGELQRFRVGGIQTLAEAGLTMLPVGIWGTFEAFPRKARVIKRGRTLSLVVGEPLEPADFSDTAQLIGELERRVAGTRELAAG